MPIDHAIGGFPASAPLVSKGGVHALTISLAAELAADNIRGNLVAPGVIRTPIHGDADAVFFGGVALLNRIREVEEITALTNYTLPKHSTDNRSAASFFCGKGRVNDSLALCAFHF